MSTADIGDTEGVNKLITKLDELYKEDKNQAAFLAYEQFEQFKRPENMKVKDYINAFKRLNNKIKAYDMVLPEGVLAYRTTTKCKPNTGKRTIGKSYNKRFDIPRYVQPTKNNIWGLNNRQERWRTGNHENSE